MFLLYVNDEVNDFYDNTSSSTRMFTDECVLIRTPTDHRYLQNDLDTIILWANKWQMNPNVNKSVVLHCTRSQSPHDYFMDSKPLPTQDYSRYNSVTDMLSQLQWLGATLEQRR